MLRRFGQRYALIGVALAAVVLAGFTQDIRWAIVSLMVIFIIFPMVMAFVALKYATLPEIAARLRANAYTISGIDLSIYEDDSTLATHRLIQRATVVQLYRQGPWDIFVIGPGIADIIILPDSLIAPADFRQLEDRLDAMSNNE